MNIRKDKRTWWIAFGLLMLLLRSLLSPEAIERYYSRGLFPLFRTFFDELTRLSPIPLAYPVLLAGIFFLSFWFYRSLTIPAAWHRKFVNAFYSLLAMGMGLSGLFLLSWGFNYGRVPVEKQMGLELARLTSSDIREELLYHTSIISTLRKGLPDVNSADSVVPVTRQLLPTDLHGEMRNSLERVLRESGFPVNGRVMCRDLGPEGILLRFGSSGVYFPFSGEGHVDKALHPLQKPFVIAHEMAHGYGFTDEGICSFWAYLACIHSNNLFIRYVGHLNYWRYLASEVRRAFPQEYQLFREQLPIAIQADLNTINDNLGKYPDILPGLRYFAYDTYLKSQGIPEGIQNYNRVIPLVFAWWGKMREKDTPRPVQVPEME